MTGPRFILIVKLSAIGDVVQTFPMVEALRKNYPEARIDWLVEEEAADILMGHPALDRVIVSRRKSWQRNVLRKPRPTLREIRDFVCSLRAREYDWVIDNHGVFKSGVMVLLCRGKRKIGFRATRKIADEGNYLFTRERYKPLDIETHAVERYVDLASQLGVRTERPSLRFEVPPESRERAEQLLKENRCASRPIVVVHPMAKWDTKQWPRENFARLTAALSARGASVVLTGSPADEAFVREILSVAGEPSRAVNLAGKTGLRELAALFALADLVITTDTGPMHMAAAVQAPLIALFGPTAPWRTGPYGESAVVLRKTISCSPCFKRSCPTVDCMKSVSVEEVLEAALDKLASRPDFKSN
ncbi:MAG TPA: lipopolysaccharide heptosyltransferase I [Thermodesulfobacteriota bacterium]|nr:lipopolysaccharide heptosyltransferase I [Thermodesulfobacteriota bacterium]